MVDRFSVYRTICLELVSTFLIAFVLNYVWEHAHAVLYLSYKGGPITDLILLHATLADALFISVIGFFTFAFRFFRERLWFSILVGVILGVGIEVWALATDRWVYSPLMPLIPVVNVGVSPAVQLGITAFVTLILVSWLSKRLPFLQVKEYSYGVIPFSYDNEGRLRVLLIKNRRGNIGFPKGHADDGELIQETALRELKEETGISEIKLDTEKIFEEQYPLLRDGLATQKRVQYFLGVYTGNPGHQADHDEIKEILEVPYEEALVKVSFPEIRRVLKEARVYFDSKNAS